MRINAIAGDTVPGIVAASTEIIPDLNPYLQAVILIISGITALIRLFNVNKKPNQTP
jgi:hypothetical protein